ncbi:MAG: hypothetical protein WDO73_32785 [Ignavibacteriota bacterium]
MRLTKDLRFYFERLENHTAFIRDRQNPGHRSWQHDSSILYSMLTQDYAVVSRFVDPLTEKLVVVVAGMGRDGTSAAGEFVTDPRYLQMLASRAPKNWEKKNLQVVLAPTWFAATPAHRASSRPTSGNEEPVVCRLEPTAPTL